MSYKIVLEPKHWKLRWKNKYSSNRPKQNWSKDKSRMKSHNLNAKNLIHKKFLFDSTPVNIAAFANEQYFGPMKSRASNGSNKIADIKLHIWYKHLRTAKTIILVTGFKVIWQEKNYEFSILFGRIPEYEVYIKFFQLLTAYYFLKKRKFLLYVFS